MKYLLLLLLSFIPLFIGCTNKPRNDAKTNVLPKTIIPTVVNQSEKQPQRLSINELTKQQLSDLESKSKIKASLLEVSNNMMSFASSSELTDNFWGHELTEKALKQRFNCELNKEIQIFDLSGEKQEVFKYSFKDTYFKIFHYPENDQDYLACGIIKDPEIFAPFGITIGMSKNSFFSNLFNESSSYDFLTIDTVLNGSADGGINQFFVFKQGVLNEIIIKSDMDWIQFE
jgi:hypothetical protein